MHSIKSTLSFIVKYELVTRSTEKNEKSQKRIQKLIDASITVKEKVKGQEPQKTSATEDCQQSNENKITFMENIDIIEYSCEHCNYQCADSASLDVHVYTKHSSLVWLSREYFKSYFWNLNNPLSLFYEKRVFYNALPVISLSKPNLSPSASATFSARILVNASWFLSFWDSCVFKTPCQGSLRPSSFSLPCTILYLDFIKSFQLKRFSETFYFCHPKTNV